MNSLVSKASSLKHSIHAKHTSASMSPLPLDGKVALITGASKGIGRAMTLRLGADGAKVVVNYSSDAGAADAVVAELGGAEHAVAVQADVSTVAGVTAVVDAAVAKFGHIDILVPNAGTMPMRTVENTTEEDFDSTFAVNVKGPYFLAQKAVPHMPEGGRIIFVSTSVAHFSSVLPAYLLYGATKGAVEQMTRIMAKGLAARGILVNCVAPGPTETELFLKGKSEQMINGIKGSSPFNKLAQPDEIAGVVSFLAGQDSRWMSGQVVKVNGAMA